MIDGVQTAGVQELSARVARLEHELGRLRERAGETSPIVKSVERKGKRLGDLLFDLCKSFIEYRRDQSKSFQEAFERIVNLEMQVFPNLVRDMKSVHRIIGSEAEGSHLDSRKTSPGNGTEKPDCPS
jgi:hypothetical protein